MWLWLMFALLELWKMDPEVKKQPSLAGNSATVGLEAILCEQPSGRHRPFAASPFACALFPWLLSVARRDICPLAFLRPCNAELNLVVGFQGSKPSHASFFV